MKKKWAIDRVWDKSNTEKRFEKLISENGYIIVGLREYQSKTDYLIQKGGVQQEFSVYHSDNSTKRGDDCFRLFEKMYDITVKYETKMRNANG